MARTRSDPREGGLLYFRRVRFPERCPAFALAAANYAMRGVGKAEKTGVEHTPTQVSPPLDGRFAPRKAEIHLAASLGRR